VAPCGAIIRYHMAPHGAIWRHMAPNGGNPKKNFFYFLFFFSKNQKAHFMTLNWLSDPFRQSFFDLNNINHPSVHKRRIFGNLHRLIALFTAHMIILGLFDLFLMDFDLFNHPSGYFRPILGRFSRFFTPFLPIGPYKVFFWSFISNFGFFNHTRGFFRPVIG
jgi:hypothetical protein